MPSTNDPTAEQPAEWWDEELRAVVTDASPLEGRITLSVADAHSRSVEAVVKLTPKAAREVARMLRTAATHALANSFLTDNGEDTE